MLDESWIMMWVKCLRKIEMGQIAKSRQNWVENFVKLLNIYACNGLTNFESKGRAISGHGNVGWELDFKSREITASKLKWIYFWRVLDIWKLLNIYACNGLTNFENKGWTITGNGNVGWELEFNCREITASKLKWIYFWRVLDIWKPALSFGEEVLQSRKGNVFNDFDNRLS